MGKNAYSVYGYNQEPFGCFVAFYDFRDEFEDEAVSFQYTYEKKSNYVLVTPEGAPESAEELAIHAEELFRKAVEWDLRCVLIDRRGSNMDFEVMDLVNVSNILDDRALQNLGVRVAVLVDADNANLFNKLETSLTIRAFSYRIFGHEEEALAWLGAGC